MGLHGNAKLGPAGRRAMVMLVEVGGLSQRQAAGRWGVGKTTVKRWVDRYRAASDEQRAMGWCFGILRLGRMRRRDSCHRRRRSGSAQPDAALVGGRG
jgi:Homeodomain-like domain